MRIKKYGIYNCLDKNLKIVKHGNTNHDVVVVKKGLFHSKVKVLSSLADVDKDGKISNVKYNNLFQAYNGQLNPLCQKSTGSNNYSGVFLDNKKVKKSDLTKRQHHMNKKVLRKYRKHLT